MKATIEIKTEKELKEFISKYRNQMTCINELDLQPLYPMLEVSNKHATYYSVSEQGSKFIHAPFTVTIENKH